MGVGMILMTVADMGETAFDFYDYGWQQGLVNGTARIVIGKLGGKLVPGDLVGNQMYRITYEGSAEVITEMTENEVIDELNQMGDYYRGTTPDENSGN